MKNMASPKEYLELLQATMDNIPENRLLSIDQIGVRNPALSIEGIIHRMDGHETRPFMAVTYRVHFPSWRERLEDFLEIGLPDHWRMIYTITGNEVEIIENCAGAIPCTLVRNFQD